MLPRLGSGTLSVLSMTLRNVTDNSHLKGVRKPYNRY